MRKKHCEVVSNVSHLNVDIQSVIRSKKSIKQWAYILHDKDDTEPHYHIYLNFGKTSVEFSDVGSWFGLDENFVNKVEGRKVDMLMYLTHANTGQEHKHQYSPKEVIANFDFESEIAVSKILGNFEQFSYAQQLEYVNSLPVEEKAKAHSQLDKLWKLHCQCLVLKPDRQIDVMFIHGKGGTGKTYYAKKLLNKMGYDFCVSSSSNDPFQDYMGQSAIILDDLRDHVFEFEDLLKLLDNNTSSSVRSRFSNKVFNGKMIVITSTVPLSYWYYGKVIKTCKTCKQQVSSDTANHTYSGSTCSACNLVCTHERWTDGKCMYCSFACQHVSYKDGKCSTCGKACSHSSVSTSYSQISNDYALHKVIKTCKTCKQQVSSDTANHTYSGSTCSACNLVCTHERWTDGKCTYCSFACQHGSYKDGRCSICNLACAHPSKHGSVVYSTNPSTHKYVYYCDVCDYPIKTILLDHKFVNGKCNSCGFLCTHSDWIDGVCVFCSYTCNHPSFIDGMCVVCSKACDHPSRYGTVVYSTNPSTHKYVYYCEVCDFATKTILLDHSFKNGKCNSCGFVCTHSSEHYEYISSGKEQHFGNIVCDYCFALISSSKFKHSFVDGQCSICDYVCAHSSYSDGKCTYCGYTCPHSDTVVSYSKISDFSVIHNVTTSCSTCKKVISITTADHIYNTRSVCTKCGSKCTHPSFDDGLCSYCSYGCLHSFYSDSRCTSCGSVCSHPTILRRVASSDGRDHEFYCAECDFSSLFELPQSSQYFSYAPFACSWNADTSVMYESSELSGYYRFFERYSINTFDESRGYNASAHIIGGSSIKDSFAFDSPINASRYLVLRVRLSGIKHLEVYAYGGDSAVVFEDVVNECSSIHIFDIENLPDGEWANLVIDMSLFNDIRNSTYSVGSEISHAFISLCFTYETVDSYADIEFFALCDDPSDIDSVVNFSATNPISHFYYLAEGSYSVNNTSVHYFESSDRCKYCGYTCEHDNHYTIDIVDDFECGVETRCELCDILIKSTVQPHSFVNNSHVCSRCLYVCYHKYSAGICIYCDRSCVHSYIGGSIKCSVCGSYVEYDGYDDKDGFLSLFTAIYDAQANTFFKMLGYEILGVNVAGLIVSVIALAVVIWLLKKVL